MQKENIVVLLIVGALWYSAPSMAQSFQVVSNRIDKSDTTFRVFEAVYDSLLGSLQDVLLVSNSVESEFHYYKQTKQGEFLSEELKVVQLARGGRAQILIQKRIGGRLGTPLTLDASQFYGVLKKNVERIEPTCYAQYLPNELMGDEQSSFLMWKLTEGNRENVKSCVYGNNTPHITYSDKNIDFPPTAWSFLVNLDIARLDKLVAPPANKSKRNARQ